MRVLEKDSCIEATVTGLKRIKQTGRLLVLGFLFYAGDEHSGQKCCKIRDGASKTAVFLKIFLLQCGNGAVV